MTPSANVTFSTVPVYRFHTGSFRSLKHPDGQHVLIGRNIYRGPCDGTLMQDTFFVHEHMCSWGYIGLSQTGPTVRGWKDVLNATDLLIKPALWMFLKLLLCHADSFSSLFFVCFVFVFAAKPYNQRWIAFWWVFDMEKYDETCWFTEYTTPTKIIIQLWGLSNNLILCYKSYKTLQ